MNSRNILRLSFTPLAIFAIATFVALTSAATTAPPWDAKDWTQWTEQDCELILSNSPWVATNSSNGPGSYEKGGRLKSIAQIASSLVIRQAAVRQAQLQDDRDHMDPAAQKQFDVQAAACLNQNAGDRIIIGLDADAQTDDSKLVGNVEISKRTYPIAQVTDWVTSNPCPFYPVVISIPRVLDGKPAIDASDKKLEIKSPSLRNYSFNPQKMIYKGKPDF
jgi:hypothetical protein